MHFTVFGDIAVADDSRILDLGGPRQRTLLAYLLTRPNQSATSGSIVDVLWDGETEPENPSRAVQTYVSRLRRTVGEDRVRSTGSGYVLIVEDGELDVDRYVEEIGRARHLHQLGDPAPAAAAYVEAERLWSGDPWADLGGRFWAVASVERLTTLRATASVELGACMLETDDPAAALEQVRPLLRIHPRRDDLRRIEMLALHRLGRSVEASRVYQLHRNAMIEQTGLEPSRELAELEAQILRDDQTLAATGPIVRGFELIERLAETATGVVWRARQPSLDRDVRLTIIHTDLANDPEFIRYFDPQIRVFSQIDHPSVGQLLDAWRDYRGAYLVSPMPLLVADSPPTGGWSSARIRNLLADVAAALAELHDHGLSAGTITRADVGLEDSGAVLLGFEAASRHPVAVESDLATLAGLGLDLLTESGDADTQLKILLDEVRSGEHSGADARWLADQLRPTDRQREPLDGAPAGAAEARFRQHLQATARNPYKGLRPFDLADAEDFFGRKDLVSELVQRITLGRFVTVVGPSGSGKSSVIRAGVLPAMMANAELGGRPWFGVTMIPGADPFEAAESALLRIAVNPPATLIDQLTADERGLLRAVDRTLPDDHSDLLLLIDQFEELWTVTPTGLRHRFVAALVEAVNAPNSRLKVVATLRADFYDRPLADPELGAMLAEGSVPLPALTAVQLEEVVLGPARRVGLEIEPSVVAEFVRAGTSDAASLPLIQFALTQLVEQRASDVIGADDLRRLGGVDGSIARRAEETYLSLDPDTQNVVRYVFGRLVTLNAGEATRRRAARSELTGHEAGRVVEAFAANRLATFDRDHETREPTVEVAHEALLTSWPRLADWINEDRDELRIVSRLVASSARWHQSGEDEAELLRGAPLAAAVALADQHPQRLSRAEHRYVEAGAERLAAEQHRERRRSRRLRQSLIAVAALLVLALIAGSVAVVQRNSAREAAFNAESFRLLQPADNLADSDPSVALLLAAEAYRRSPSPETLGVIQRVMLETGPFLGQRLAGVDSRAVRWLDDDRLVALSAESVVLFSSSTGEIFDQATFEWPADDPLISVRFYEPKVAVDSAGGQVAVTAAGGAVELFEASGDRLAKTASIKVGVPLRSLAFAPDGVAVYAGDANGSVHEIDLIGQEVTDSWDVFEGPEWEVPDGYSTGDVHPDLARWLNQNGVASVYVTDEFVAAVGGSRISLWDREARTVLWSDYAVDPSLGGPDGEPVLVFPRWIGGSDEEDRNELHLTGPIDLVGSIDAVTGLQQWRRNKGLTGFSFVAFGVETVFAGGLGVSVAEDGAVRKIDPVSGTPHGEVLPITTGRPVGIDLAPGGRTAAVATTTGVTVIAIDGSGLLNDAFPVTVRPDELTIASGGLVAGTASYSTGAVTVFDRTDAGFEQRVLDFQRSPTLINLSGLQTGDPRLGVESWVAEDGNHSFRVIDTRTLEPISDWLHDAAAVLAIDHDNGIQYVRHELENARRPNGDHLFRIYRWPNGPEAAEPIEVPTGEVGAYPKIVLEGGRLVIGTHPLPGTLWAFDMDRRQLVDPPFTVEAGVKEIRYGPDRTRILVTRVDGSIEERDASTYEIVRQMAGPERPTGATDTVPVIVDPRRGLWMTAYGSHPRLLDPDSGVQIGATFPHDDREILAGVADGFDGAPMQLVTMVEGTARVWNLATETWFDLACSAAGRNLTEAEWELLGPRDAQYQVTCPQWPGAS